MIQENYLTENTGSTEKGELRLLKKNVKTLEIENKFLKNDVHCKQNLTDSLLKHNLNLHNHQSCLVIHDIQSNVRRNTNTD